jgi:hypothetical protein
MTPNLRVKDLLCVAVSAWVKIADVLIRKEVVTRLGKTAVGHRVRE